MKKSIAFLLLLFMVIPGYIMAQDESEIYVPKPEMQISVGPSFGIAAFEEKNTIWFPGPGGYVYPFESDLSSLLWVAGIDFKMRVYIDTNARYTQGLVVGGRVMFALSGEQKGYVNDIWSKEKLAKDEFISIMDIGIGISSRLKLSRNLSFIPEYGINFTVMGSEDDDGNEFNYLGVGIFGNLFLQFDITKTMYLEFGFNSVINMFSSQEGKVRNYAYNPNRFVEYEDTGRWDQVSVTFSICVGWRIDLSGN